MFTDRTGNGFRVHSSDGFEVHWKHSDSQGSNYEYHEGEKKISVREDNGETKNKISYSYIYADSFQRWDGEIEILLPKEQARILKNYKDAREFQGKGKEIVQVYGIDADEQQVAKVKTDELINMLQQNPNVTSIVSTNVNTGQTKLHFPHPQEPTKPTFDAQSDLGFQVIEDRSYPFWLGFRHEYKEGGKTMTIVCDLAPIASKYGRDLNERRIVFVSQKRFQKWDGDDALLSKQEQERIYKNYCDVWRFKDFVVKVYSVDVLEKEVTKASVEMWVHTIRALPTIENITLHNLWSTPPKSSKVEKIDGGLLGMAKFMFRKKNKEPELWDPQVQGVMVCIGGVLVWSKLIDQDDALPKIKQWAIQNQVVMLIDTDGGKALISYITTMMERLPEIKLDAMWQLFLLKSLQTIKGEANIILA